MESHVRGVRSDSDLFCDANCQKNAHMNEVLQSTIPFDYANPKPLPGIMPLDPKDWLIFDDAFAGQMYERERLLSEKRDDVIALVPTAIDAAVELLDEVLLFLCKSSGFLLMDNTVKRPDGGVVQVDYDDPLGTLARLVQNDFCILQKQGDEHVLTGASLCFPASWSLSEKYMRPLVAIHDPVDSYDENIAKRVQRLFDGIQVGRPLWRFNVLNYAVSTLHHPRTHAMRRSEAEQQSKSYIRSERQTLLRLPKTKAVIFGIHTFVIKR